VGSLHLTRDEHQSAEMNRGSPSGVLSRYTAIASSMNPSIFRRVALDRLSSPEQLDQLMQVTNPRGWIALAGYGAMIAGAVVWGITGRVSDQVHGQGILIRSGGVLEVTTLTSGQVVDLAVRVGEMVDAGQVIARVAQPELVRRIHAARVELEVAATEHDRAREFLERDRSLRVETLAQQREGLVEAIRVGEQRIGWMADRLAAQEQLVTQGLVTRQALLNTRGDLESARERVHAAEVDLRRVEVERLSIQNQLENAMLASRYAVEQKERALLEHEAELDRNSRVVSSHSGRVLEVMTEPGGVIARGEPLLTLDLAGRTIQELEAVVYVPAAQGKKVSPGMEIQITPANVRKEDFGVMLGRVTYVSDFPATSRGMGRVLKNDQLVSTLSGGGAPYEVRAELIPDPSTRSRYRWSSSKGPPSEVHSGTLASAAITVAERRPVALVLPLLRRYSGL
jgi:HlyD family secretion protein